MDVCLYCLSLGPHQYMMAGGFLAPHLIPLASTALLIKALRMIRLTNSNATWKQELAFSPLSAVECIQLLMCLSSKPTMSSTGPYTERVASSPCVVLG